MDRDDVKDKIDEAAKDSKQAVEKVRISTGKPLMPPAISWRRLARI